MSASLLPLRRVGFISFLLLPAFVAAPVSAQCFDPPPTNPIEVLVASGYSARSATIGMDGQGRFVIAFQQDQVPGQNNESDVFVMHYCQDGAPAAGPIALSEPDQQILAVFKTPSAAMSLDGHAIIGFVGSGDDFHFRDWETAYFSLFQFGQAPATPVAIPGRTFDPYEEPSQFDVGPSVGITNSGPVLGIWERGDFLGASTQGLPLGIDFYEPSWLTLVRECGVTDDCQYFIYEPCLAMRPTDAYFAVVYAEAETNQPFPAFNIAESLRSLGKFGGRASGA